MGNFSKRADIVAKDEIGLLSKSFNVMTENLEKTTVSKEYFDSIVRNMSDILIVADKNLGIETINNAGIELFGYSRKELIGRPLFDLIEKNESVDSINSAIITTDEFKNFEIKLRRKGKKSILSLFSTAAVKNSEGKTKYFICTAKDISERKRAEDELKEYTKRIEYINKELDSYSYIVSHDLKEPLRSINAFSRFIMDDYKDKLDETGRKYLERIQKNAVRIQNIIEDFVEISNLEKFKNPFEEIRVESIIDEVKLRLEKEIAQKNARIIINGELPVICCDCSRFTSVFVNLVSNAIKFADKDPPVIEIGCKNKGEYFEFYVKDNGPGIEEQYFERIFRLFQRLVKREEYEGIGVGLTIVKKIIDLHKGEVWVESKVGEGATFYFTLPVKMSLNSKENFGQFML
jgi:PAS domain S-box-containing protein